MKDLKSILMFNVQTVLEYLIKELLKDIFLYAKILLISVIYFEIFTFYLKLKIFNFK